MDTDALAEIAAASPAHVGPRIGPVVAAVWARSLAPATECREAVADFLLGNANPLHELLPEIPPQAPVHPSQYYGPNGSTAISRASDRLALLEHRLLSRQDA